LESNKFGIFPGARIAPSLVQERTTREGPGEKKILFPMGAKMKKNIFCQIVAIVLVSFAFMLVVRSDHTWAQTQLRQSVERKFEEYRTAIKDSYQVDIKNFKDKIPGGMADGKAITNYDLKELLEGIKWEREHTNDSLLALEMAMDHLERMPDYYTHLNIMERQCAEEKFRDK
jgi:Protein of unknown function (DUF5661)